MSRMGMGTRARGLIGGGLAALTLSLFAAGCSEGPELVGQPMNLPSGFWDNHLHLV